MFHDTHAHVDLLLQKLGHLPPERGLNLEQFPGLAKHSKLDPQLVDGLLKEHDWVIQPSISTANFILNQRLWVKFPKIYLLLGSHPEIVEDDFDLPAYLDNQRDLVLQLESDETIFNQVIGVGEVGLDYFHGKTDITKQKQRELFESQIALAIRLKLPLVIHCREAFLDLFAILRDFPEIHGNFLVHCFTAGARELKQICDLGGLVGIGGVVTFNSAKDLQEAIKYCPEDVLTLETDLPFLAPAPYRGEVCLPKYIQFVAEKVAKLRNLEVRKVWHISAQNATRLFGEL
jgi:TatD DNase family protein